MGMDTDVAARIEANLPLVKHVVFQVAVHFPRQAACCLFLEGNIPEYCCWFEQYWRPEN